MLSGASVRYRFYTRWGVTAEELSRIVFSYSVTFWLGLLALGGLSLAMSPLPATQRASGAAVVVAGRLAARAVERRLRGRHRGPARRRSASCALRAAAAVAAHRRSRSC